MEKTLPEHLKHTLDELQEAFGEKVLQIHHPSGDLHVRVHFDALLPIAEWLHGKGYIYITDVIGTDRYETDDRFEVLYNLLSLRDQQRLFLVVRLPEENPTVASVTPVWPAANWYEREVYDMFGIRFDGHPDLRRMYMPEDYAYYPLRKEFPLLGIPGSIDLPGTTPESE